MALPSNNTITYKASLKEILLKAVREMKFLEENDRLEQKFLPIRRNEIKFRSMLGTVAHALISAPGRKKQGQVCEFQASWDTKRDPSLKQKTNETAPLPPSSAHQGM